MIDKNLFLYDLVVTAVFKDEGRYLKEWLDYHLAAGVEHFYLYNNDSTDDYKEVLAPYVDGGLVTLINFHGKTIQIPAYNDALERFKFYCRYMAFIDIDEFIYPKSARSVSEVVAEVLSTALDAVALGVNWHCFGSNGQVKADYSRGVLERFTRRAPDHWQTTTDKQLKPILPAGNRYVKLILNPRSVRVISFPHQAILFEGKRTVNEHGETIEGFANDAMTSDKIIVNHYYTKSREEFMSKHLRGDVYNQAMDKYTQASFDVNDRNEIFDDGILRYRAARADKVWLESEASRCQRVEKTLEAIV